MAHHLDTHIAWRVGPAAVAAERPEPCSAAVVGRRSRIDLHIHTDAGVVHALRQEAGDGHIMRELQKLRQQAEEGGRRAGRCCCGRALQGAARAAAVARLGSAAQWRTAGRDRRRRRAVAAREGPEGA